MGTGKRPSVCYIVPGHSLLPSAGPSRNVLNLAHALSEWADVTVAFRRVLEPLEPERFRVTEIEPGRGQRQAIDDAAVRGVGYGEFAGYVRAIRRFARERLSQFDVVLEKSWLLTGYVSALASRRNVPAIPVVNLVPVFSTVSRNPTKVAKNWVGRWLSGRYLRRAPLVVAETAQLKAAIADYWRVPPERIEVIGLGVDRTQFRPLDQAEARRRLAISEDSTVLLYVGALDRTHDLRPAIEAMVKLEKPAAQFHVVGDGALAEELRVVARGDGRIRFHGRVSHHEVPHYIAAADLCLAPYDPRAFPNGEVGYATLKVREYLAGARPVATMPSGPLRELVRDGETGFLLPNDAAAWTDLLQRRLPRRERLREMGRLAAETPLESWEDTARAFRSVCERVVAEARGREQAR